MAILVPRGSKVAMMLLERVRSSWPPCLPCLFSSHLGVRLEWKYKEDFLPVQDVNL